MYTAYFGLREKPFSASPNPRFFYANPGYNEAYASLVYAIQYRMGFAVLTGEAGTGKTTILRRLMDELGGQVSFVFFYNTNLTFEELLAFACSELRIEVAGGRLERVQALNEFLLKELARGSTAVLLIDEAQNLKPGVLEELRLLSNLETGTEKLLQIVLVGQPELELILDKPELRQLKQRVVVHRQIGRLSAHEVGAFIRCRLELAGWSKGKLFSSDAVERVAVYSRGIPRLVNVLCDNALVIAFATNKKRVSAETVEEAARDLRLLYELKGAELATGDAAYLADRSWRGSRTLGGWTFAVALFLVGSVLLLAAGAVMFTSANGGDPLGRAEELLAPLQSFLRGLDPAPEPKAAPQEPSLELASAPLPTATPIAATPTAEPTPTLEVPPTPTREPKALVPERARASETLPTAPEPATGSPPPSLDRLVVVARGVPVLEILEERYGPDRDLGMDLTMEQNPQVADLFQVEPGESLRLPPLNEATLVRMESDATYTVVLGAFRQLREARTLAEAVALKGYGALVRPRRLSGNDVLYRVEIRGLRGPDEARKAWNAARTNGWLRLAGRARAG